MHTPESKTLHCNQGEDKRLLAFLKHSFDVIVLIDQNATIQYVSPAIVGVLGYSPDEVIGRNGFVQIHPEDVGEVRTRFEEILRQSGNVTALITRVLHKDGSWRWIESRLTNLLDIPTIGALVANFRDITDRQASEHRLQEQQEYWRIALTSTGDAVIVTNSEGRVTFMNAMASTLCGWPVGEAISQPLTEVFHIVNERTRLTIESPVEQVIAHGRIVGIANHVVLIARDGRETAIDDSTAPIFNDAGRISGVILVFRDIQEKRRAEQLRQHLAAIVESSDDIIVSKTVDGIITSWNKGAERVLGYTAEEVIGKHVSMLIPAEHAKDIEKILTSIRRGGRIDHYLSKRRRKDRTIVDVSLTVSPIRNEEGEIIGASKVGRDITTQKMLEMQLEEFNRRNDEFLAMLAREVRNPLVAIQGASQFLGKLVPDADLEWPKAVIDRQIRDLSRLIDDLLDLSRINNGKIALRKEPVDLATIFSSALENVRPLVEDRKHEVKVSLAAGDLRLEADPLRLEQILVNLLAHSAKYTSAGGRLSLAASRGQGEIVINLRDTGGGIAAEMLPRTFDLFVREDWTIDRAEGGLGVGLTIVKRLVEMHGGSVTATSEGLGKGSEFTIRLPSLTASHRTVRDTRADHSRITRSNSKVLVVDDNHDMATGLTKMLTLFGYDTQAAYDGKTAIELALNLRPAIVLLDIGLPGMSGYEVVRQLRAENACQDALFIAIAGYGQEQDIRKSDEAGFHHHMAQPIDYHKLLHVMARMT